MAGLNLYNLWSDEYISVQNCWKSESVLVYHHGEMLTMPTFLLLEYGFLTDVRLDAKKKKRKRQLFKPQLFSTYHVFKKTGKPRLNVSAVEVILYHCF